MKLEILLPYRVLLRQEAVLRIVAETAEGSFGLLPRRLDCVAALVPGILAFETAADGEAFVAVDAGVLVKAGDTVRVSVRHAMQGSGLRELRAAVEHEFKRVDAIAGAQRQVLDKLESGFAARYTHLQQGSR